MIRLLKTTEARQLKLIEYLWQTNDWVHIEKIAEELDCSPRAIKSDLSYFRNKFTKFRIDSSTNGIKLYFETNNGLKSVYRHYLIESDVFKLLELLLLSKDIQTEEIMEKLYISKSTLYRLIHNTNLVLQSKFALEISTHPFQIIGDEQNIRYFYYTFLSERYLTLGWPFPSIDEDIIDDFLLLIIEMTGMEATHSYYNAFKLISLINLFRYKNGHLLDRQQIQLDFSIFKDDFAQYKEAFRPMEEKIGIIINEEAIIQIFYNFMRYDYSINYQKMMEKTETDTHLQETVSYLSDLIDQLAHDHQLPLPNKEEIILHTTNAAYAEGYGTRSRHILYSQNNSSIMEMQRMFPAFFQDMTAGLGVFRSLNNLPSTEYTMNFLIYTFITYWQNLLPALMDKWPKISAVIISDVNTGHAELMKEVIEYLFSNEISIQVFRNTRVSPEIIQQLDVDLVLANFPLPDSDRIKMINIDNIPTRKNLAEIGQFISHISRERNQRSYYLDIYN